ncbi:MAG TPA: hypothetical protein VFZ34_27335 [Blastocatellia bacterium]|nr:hypothetical protein [Blastocatellia bacterium]
MLRKPLVHLVVSALLWSSLGLPAVAAKSKAEKEAQRIQKVKANILRLGTGPEARVVLVLQDKTKLVGHVRLAGDESFTVVEAKTGTETTITYPQVKTARGHNLSTGAKIAIGVAVGVGIVLLIVWLKICQNEGGCGG